MVVDVYNPSTQEAEAGGSEFELNLVYIVNFRPVRVTR